jgi:hypothetical protein
MPARRTARSMLQRLAIDAKVGGAIRLRCIEWVMVLDGLTKAERITTLQTKATADIDEGLSKLIGEETPEKFGENG